jgi:hypothetical protein
LIAAPKKGILRAGSKNKKGSLSTESAARMPPTNRTKYVLDLSEGVR